MSQYRILALSGGGIRGVVSATILAEVEKKLTAPIGSYFDLIAGTSTGSLLAVGLAKGLSAAELLQVYLEYGEVIFPNFAQWLPRKLKQFFQDRFSFTLFDDAGLKTTIQQKLGANTLFKEIPKPLVITAYEIWNQAAVVFKNTKEAHANLPVWEICQASCTYPGVFPSHLLSNETAIADHLKIGPGRTTARYTSGGRELSVLPLIDGGFIAGNPGLCGLAERLRWNNDWQNNPQKWILPCPPPPVFVPLEEIFVVQVNTGREVNKITPVKARQWGLGRWQLQAINALFTGNNLVTDYILRQLIGDKNCIYLQPPLEGDDIKAPIVANSNHYNAMCRATQKYLQGAGREEFEKLVNYLTR